MCVASEEVMFLLTLSVGFGGRNIHKFEYVGKPVYLG